MAGSLITGSVRAHDLFRALGRDGNPTPLGASFRRRPDDPVAQLAVVMLALFGQMERT